jgi:ferritin
MIKACREESEYGTELFLMEMAREQVEEINVFDTLRRRVISCNDCPSALLIIDHDLKD